MNKQHGQIWGNKPTIFCMGENSILSDMVANQTSLYFGAPNLLSSRLHCHQVLEPNSLLLIIYHHPIYASLSPQAFHSKLKFSLPKDQILTVLCLPIFLVTDETCLKRSSAFFSPCMIYSNILGASRTLWTQLLKSCALHLAFKYM